MLSVARKTVTLIRSFTLVPFRSCPPAIHFASAYREPGLSGETCGSAWEIVCLQKQQGQVSTPHLPPPETHLFPGKWRRQPGPLRSQKEWVQTTSKATEPGSQFLPGGRSSTDTLRPAPTRRRENRGISSCCAFSLRALTVSPLYCVLDAFQEFVQSFCLAVFLPFPNAGWCPS